MLDENNRGFVNDFYLIPNGKKPPNGQGQRQANGGSVQDLADMDMEKDKNCSIIREFFRLRVPFVVDSEWNIFQHQQNVGPSQSGQNAINRDICHVFSAQNNNIQAVAYNAQNAHHHCAIRMVLWGVHGGPNLQRTAAVFQLSLCPIGSVHFLIKRVLGHFSGTVSVLKIDPWSWNFQHTPLINNWTFIRLLNIHGMS